MGRGCSVAVRLRVGGVGCLNGLVIDSETDLHGRSPFSFCLFETWFREIRLKSKTKSFETPMASPRSHLLSGRADASLKKIRVNPRSSVSHLRCPCVSPPLRLCVELLWNDGIAFGVSGSLCFNTRLDRYLP
jgi:hypothetical protein